MRILMVAPYPPIRDGVASYAVQEVAALLDEGHDVEVLSPWPSAAHHHLALRGPRGPLALAKRVHRYDRVIIQYHPDVFYPSPLDDRDQLLVTAGLIVAFRRSRNVEVRIHELNFAWGREPGLHARLFRTLWRLPATITVHTEHERQRMADAVGLDARRIKVRDHGHTFVRRATIDRRQARARLGIDDSTFMFLAIGFVQEHKGFDRAVRAFDGLADHDCRLDIVGSVRVDEPAYVEYARRLRRLVESTRGARMHEGYVSDEIFDVWLVAADVLLLPYRYIWSSSVLQRAAMYDTRVIATRVGGLDEQEHANVRLVDDDLELAMVMREVAHVPVGRAASEQWPDANDSSPDRHAIQAAVRERARTFAEGATRTVIDATVDGQPSLRSVPLLQLAPTTSRNPLAAVAKKVVRTLTAWQLGPVVDQVNTVHRAAAHDVADREPER